MRPLLKTLCLVLCAVPAVLYVMTWDPVWLVLLISVLVALGASCLRTRLEASARLADPDYDRKVKEGQFKFVVPGLGVLSLVLASYFFIAEGWNWSLFWPLAFGLYCVWVSRWGLRRLRQQNPHESS